MLYVCIGLFIINVYLAAHSFFLRRSISKTTKQMEEIEKFPERNRQLNAFTTDSIIEQLLKKINDLYQARQQERIVYQKRETQIRREIENISHDLRTPLTSIIGYVDLIKDPMTEETQRKEYLLIIQKRAKVLQGFIQDFYELSRMEGENYPIVFDVVKVQNTLSDTIVAYYNEFEEKQIQVEINFEKNPCFIIVDKIQFNRILNNLIQNALKYSIRLFVLKQYTLDGECIIQFQNDKNQMKESELEIIFDRFYTGDLSRNNQSTGLGLTISKLLVETMKGKIEAKIVDNLFVIELRFKRQ